MRRLLWHRVARADDGMSLVEVVVAMAILLFALTAVLSLVIASTGMSASARAEGLATKTANRFIERVRAEPYENLNQTKLNQMAATMSAADSADRNGGMTVVITPSITPYRDASQPASSNAAYQSVKVVVAVSGPGFKSYQFSTGTYVREWKWSAGSGGGGGGGGGGGQIPPTVAFDTQTPAAGSPDMPIWDNGSGVHVGAVATSNMSGVALSSIWVKWQSSYLASGTPGANPETAECETIWNTGALNAEGRQVILFAEVRDALSQPGSVSRNFIIDNVKPPAPGSVTLSPPAVADGNTKATWTWPTVMDGETAAPDYVVTVNRMETTGAWTGTVLPSVVATAASVTTGAFTRYYPSVLARGPRAAAGLPGQSGWVSASTNGPGMVTRPGFSAMTVVVAQQNNSKPFYFTASSLAITPPTFPAESGTAPNPYQWQYKIGNGAWTNFATSAYPNTNPSKFPTVAFPKVTGPSAATPSLSFRCTATMTIGGVANTPVKSPIMTVNNPNGGTTYTLTGFTPDWTVW